MAILKIALMGHPVLRRTAQPVPNPAAPEHRELIDDMRQTMVDATGVGLAAPQVFAGRRIIMFCAPASRAGTGSKTETEIPETVLINPEIEPFSDEVALGWEGCLSLPRLRGLVPRWRHIGYRGYSPDGTLIECEAFGFLARVIQHELDHLNGILYLDRIIDSRLITYEEEMADFRHEDYIGLASIE